MKNVSFGLGYFLSVNSVTSVLHLVNLVIECINICTFGVGGPRNN